MLGCEAAFLGPQVRLKEVAIYLDFKLDESYTPSRVSIRIGTSFYDLREIAVLDLHEPQGWIRTLLAPPASNECAPPDVPAYVPISRHL